MMRKYIIPDSILPEELKEIRIKLSMTQSELAAFLGCSRPTVERWEEGKTKISGPVITLMELLKRDLTIPEKLAIPDERYKMRLYYMYRSEVCTIIDIDETDRKVKIKNFTDNPQMRAFGVNTEPSFEEYEEFIESRCFPRSRDKLKLELKRLDIPFYDPILIIEKTEGRMAEDEFWIRIDR
jgi:putative transcriptional regulator